MLNNLAGWHLLIIVGVLAIMASVVVGVILLIVRASRRSAPDRVAAPAADPAGQIQKLAQLREQGLLTDAEYEAKRTDLLGRI